MQKILWTLGMVTLILFVQSPARAQEQEQEPFKRNLIGGSLSFSSSTTTTSSGGIDVFGGTSIIVNPTYVHYLKPNVGIGLVLGYSHYTSDEANMLYTKYTSNAYSFSPFIRLDIPLWQSRFSIFNDLGIGGTFSRTSADYTDGTHLNSDGWGLSAFYNPGLMFQLKSNISLQASFASLVRYNYNDTGNAHSFGITPNHSINDLTFGVNFLF